MLHPTYPLRTALELARELLGLAVFITLCSSVFYLLAPLARLIRPVMP
jgi:hypothetical protein